METVTTAVTNAGTLVNSVMTILLGSAFLAIPIGFRLLKGGASVVGSLFRAGR